MNNRAAFAASAMLALAACAFSSEQPFFTPSDAAQPFSEGRYTLREDGGGTQALLFRRANGGYRLRPVNEPDSAWMPVLFVPVRQTPEDDYIVQVQLRTDENARAYAFMWPAGRGYRLITLPSELEDQPGGEHALTARCASRPNGECQVAKREDLLALYNEIVYPAFVIGGQTPDDYMDLSPAPD